MGLVDVVGKKWAVCIVTLLGRHGRLRFGEVQSSLLGVSPATLTSTLRALERESILRRVPYTGDGRTETVYELTGQGMDLQHRLLPLAGWLRVRHESEVHRGPLSSTLHSRARG